ASILRVPYRYLYPVLFAVALMAVYSISGRIFDVFLALGFALVEMLMRNQGYPLAPIILVLVLGGMIETQLRRSVMIGGNSLSMFLDRPIAMAILIIAVLMVVIPIIVRFVRKRKRGAVVHSEREMSHSA